MNFTASAEAAAKQRQRLQELQREQAEIQQQLQVQQFAAGYAIQLDFPANITSANNKLLRTNQELIQHRLMELGILYEVPVTVGAVLKASNELIANLERTGCFNSVQVQVGASSSSAAEPGQPPQRQLQVVLDEANWYRIYAGGGLKQDGLMSGGGAGKSLSTSVSDSSASTGFLPTAEAEVSVGLRNLAGVLDTTQLQYRLDTKSIASWSLIHQRPLYTVLPSSDATTPVGLLASAGGGSPAGNGLRENVLAQPRGSQYAFEAKALIDTVDFEWTRSYKEFQRLLAVRVASHREPQPNTAQVYSAVEWSATLRDVIPRRHASLPYALDASAAIVSQSGPSFKHSVKAEIRTNGTYCNDSLQPTEGWQAHAQAEVATPPGDVGFVRAEAGASVHGSVPISSRGIALHAALNAGYLQSWSWGGLCRPATVSDRFYVGGPLQLRGFSPAGIGPRADPNTTTGKTRGDSLGGDFYYTATAMASLVPAPVLPWIQQYIQNENNELPVRLFGFVNAGTCVGTIHSLPLRAVLESTRVAVGVGLATTLMGPRLEVTYAMPLRYGPRDYRRNLQFGMGFSFG